MAVAVGAVVFMQSLVATSDAQSVRVAERLLEKVPVEADALVARMQLDFRPGYRCVFAPNKFADHKFDWGLNFGVRYTF